MNLSVTDIVAAQRNELAGITAVLAALEDRIASLAGQAARRIDHGQREDFAQDAREALFLAIPRYDVARAKGDQVDGFIGFVYASMADALKDRVREQRYCGVDKDAVKVFMSVLDMADGNPCEAERLAQIVPPKGLRLSADRAYAARLAWQGAESLDRPTGEDEFTLADTLAVVDTAPLVVRPKVGRGAVLEALSVLERHVLAPLGGAAPAELFKALEALRTGFVTPSQADAVADVVTVPADAAQRRYVLDAVAILYSAASTAEDGDLVAELRDAADDRTDERAAKIMKVHTVLNAMGEGQRKAVAHSFGIGDVKCYGHGDGADSEGLAAELGTSVANVRPAKTKGLKAFAKRWIALVARTEYEALSLAQAATQNLSAGGRK